MLNGTRFVAQYVVGESKGIQEVEVKDNFTVMIEPTGIGCIEFKPLKDVKIYILHNTGDICITNVLDKTLDVDESDPSKLTVVVKRNVTTSIHPPGAVISIKDPSVPQPRSI